MDSSRSPRVVAVLDCDPDTTEMIKTWLEFKGIVVAVGNLFEFRLGKDDLMEFLRRTRPDVIVYDLGPPYETNYDYLQKIREHPAFPDCKVVITTSNSNAVKALLGVHAIEILGKPYDLQALAEAVQADGPTAPSDYASGNGDGDLRKQGDRRTGTERRAGDAPVH